MVDNREDFFIREDQALEALSLEKTELDSVIDTLTKSENFDFEEGVHFRYVNQAQKIREFARLALIVIAEYFESKGELNQSQQVINLLKKLITQEEQKQIDKEITALTLKVIHDDSNKIVVRRNRHWLSYRDVKTILKTTFRRLDKAFEDIARSDLPLMIEEDFEDIEDERYYSYSGLERISLELSEKLTSKYRRLYSSRVPKIAPSIIEETAQSRLPFDTEIERAKKEALKQQDNKCQVTRKSKSEASLEVHHLYSQNTYPELASDQDNLFVIVGEVHKGFHNWHEGPMKPCTINDFIRFIQHTTRYGETHLVLARLDARKRSLEQKIKTRSKFLLAPAPLSQRETTINSSDFSVDRSLAKIQELQQIKDSETLLILFWHRRDLRISDNIGLAKACEKSHKIIGCFCLDPNILKADDIAPARVSYLLGCLAELKKSYEKLGSQLLILQGEPETKILELAEALKVNSIFWNLDTEPYAQKRDQQIAQQLREKNIKVETFWDQLLHYPGSILSQSKTVYTVYTPFWKNWIQQPKANIAKTPDTLQGLSNEQIELVKKIGVIELPKLQELGFIWDKPLLLSPGEKAAQERLDFFVETSLSNYQERRNFPAIDGTSQLSAALKFGAIAIRTVWQKTIIALENSRSDEEKNSIKTWQQELAWREFYQHCLFFFPDLAQGPYRDIFKQFSWDNSETYFQAWCDGKTGYPMIDAAMRQLNDTGWMHNRCRMIVASFLTKDLIINWQWGEKYFMQTLYDGDLAANNGGWQWSASSGMDAKPLRIFNPMTQAQKFDPEGEYIRQWLPELRTFDTKSILTGNISRLERLAVGYPEPIVDHHHQQQVFKQRYQAMKA